jgi:hypothetical protein
MDVEITRSGACPCGCGDVSDLVLDGVLAGRYTEHGLRDLESELARRRAMGRVCPEKDGEHTCSLAPGHGEAHQCRGCEKRWMHVRALP